MKLLPVSLRIGSPGCLSQFARGHLDQPGLILIEPEAEQYQVGALEAHGGRTGRSVVKKLAVKKIVKSFDGDFQLCRSFCLGIKLSYRF